MPTDAERGLGWYMPVFYDCEIEVQNLNPRTDTDVLDLALQDERIGQYHPSGTVEFYRLEVALLPQHGLGEPPRVTLMLVPQSYVRPAVGAGNNAAYEAKRWWLDSRLTRQHFSGGTINSTWFYAEFRSRARRRFTTGDRLLVVVTNLSDSNSFSSTARGYVSGELGGD